MQKSVVSVGLSSCCVQPLCCSDLDVCVSAGCYKESSNPTALGQCISKKDPTLRGVTGVSSGNALRAYLYAGYFYFAHVRFHLPTASVIILPSAAAQPPVISPSATAPAQD